MSKPNKPYKQSKVVLDKKLSLPLYLLTMVCAVAARTAQLQTNVNFASGKYIDPSVGKNYTLWVLIIGFVLTALVLIFGESRDKVVDSCILLNPMRLQSDKLNSKISTKAGAVMLIMAFLIVFDIFLDLSKVASVNMELSTEDDPVFIFAGIPVLEWFVYAMAIVSVVTFITMGINIIRGDGLSKGNCVFLSAFAVWKLLQIFDMIGKYQIIGIYSEKVYIMFTAMSSAAFFICAAKLFGGFEKKHTRFWVIMFGYMSSIYAAVSTIPRYIIFFTKSFDDRFGMETPATADVGLIFASISIVVVFWSAYVYKDMPKLDLKGKSRWKGISVTEEEMEMKSIEDDQ